MALMTMIAPALLCARAGLGAAEGLTPHVAACFGMGVAFLICAARMTHPRKVDESFIRRRE